MGHLPIDFARRAIYNSAMDTKLFATQLGIHPEIAALLVKRGIDTVEAAKAFLYPQLQDMRPAAGIHHIIEAVQRIRAAIEGGERILVFGDYDCDGITATAILTHFLRSVGADVCYHIPRRQDGYGLSEQAVEAVVEAHLPDLMITVDCGITSVVEVEYAQDLGVDVIVTDHHEPQEDLPDCVILNPKLGEDEALKNICGAAVAMKLVEGLAGKEVADRYLDLACLATVADVVPLLGENRTIVYYGLKALANTRRKGLKALIKSCELEEITSSDIGFRIAPRINALGRLGDDADVVELLLTDDDFVVRQLVDKINAANTARQTLTKQLASQAYLKLQDYDLATRRVIVLWDEKWEPGVLGLVASRLAQEFYRPVVLLSNVGDCYKGSARSVEGVNIFACLQAVDNLMLGYGGHMGAAGMSVSAENLKVFADQLNDYICRAYPDEVFVPKHRADIVYDRATMQADFFAELARLEPFGECNPTPKFLLRSADYRLTRIGETEHVKCKVAADVDLVYFGGQYLLGAASTGVGYDYYCDAGKRVYQNRAYIQLNVTDAVAGDVSGMRDGAPAFGNYLKTVLYPPKQVGTRLSTLAKEIASLSGTHGVLFVAFGVDSARAFLKDLAMSGKKGLLGRIAVGKTDANPLHTLLLAPTDFTGWQYYSSIVFLDAPLSVGYLAAVGAKAPNPELVLLPNYAFTKQIANLHLGQEEVQKSLVAIRRVDAAKYRTLDELAMQMQSAGYYVSDAYAHFYILYELGIVAVGAGFRLQFRELPIVLDDSRVYKNLIKLREKL